MGTPLSQKARKMGHPALRDSRSGWGGSALGQDLADAADLGAYAFEFFFDIFVSAVDVVDAIDDGFAFRDQSGQDQGRGSAQIGSLHGGRAQRCFPAHDGAAAFDLDIGPHAHQFQNVHETVLENIFDDDRRSLGLRSQRHVLGLHVSGKSRVLFGCDVRSLKRSIAHNPDGLRGLCRLDADLVQLGEQRAEMTGVAACNVYVSAGQGAGDEESASFDPVGNDAVLRAVQLAHAVDANGGGAGALDARSHLVQQVGEVGDFGFAGAILQHGFAVGQGSSHEQVFSTGHGNFVEYDVTAPEAVSGGFDVSVILGNFRAELFQSLDMKVDGASADGAASWQRDSRAAAAGDQGAEDER